MQDRKKRASCLVTATGLLGLLALGACHAAVDVSFLDQQERRAFGPGSSPIAGEQSKEAKEQTGQANPPDGLAALLYYGLAHNPGLKARFHEWRAALEKIPQAEALPDPVLGFAHFIEDVQTRTGPQRNRFGLTQSFPWFGTLGARGKLAAKKADVFWQKVLEHRIALTRDIELVYRELEFLEKDILLTHEQLELLKQLEPVVQRQVQLGAAQSGLLRLQVEIGKIEDEERSLIELRPALFRRLSALIHWQSETSLRARAMVEPALERDALDASARQAECCNPELARLRSSLDASSAAEELAGYSGYPSFSVGVDYLETGSALNPGTPGSGDDPWAIRVGMSLPIWRDKYSAERNEARQKLHAAARALDDASNRIRADLEMELYRQGDAVRQVKLYRDSLLPRAREALEVVQVSYRAGKSTVLELIDSERSLLAFERAYWRACSSYLKSGARLRALIGEENRK